MELLDAMRTTGTCRYFDEADVPDDVLYDAFEAARFGPQGGNRQPARWILVRDQATKRALADLYQPRWRAYASPGGRRSTVKTPVGPANDFAENFANLPIIGVLCAKIESLYVTDKDLDRTSVVGGASIYPHMQNVCLALRDKGVATAVTTFLCADEPAVRTLLDIPEDYLTAAHLGIGYPAKKFPIKLRRGPVSEFVYTNRFGAPLFDAQSGT